MSQMFSYIYLVFNVSVIFYFRDLLWTLTETELHTLEKMLCSQEEPKIDEKSSLPEEISLKIPEDTISQIYKKQLNCKQFIHDFYAYNFGTTVPENGIPESSEDSLIHSKCPVDVKRSDKGQNNNIEFDVKFQHDSGQRKSPELHESDIETLVPGDFGTLESDEVFCNVQNRYQFYGDRNVGDGHSQEQSNKDLENIISDGTLRTSVDSNHPLSDSVDHRQDGHLHNDESCAYCSSESVEVLEHTSSYESHLSRLHTDCTCGTNSSSHEHLTPSREIMRQVMRRVEIVPPGQRIVGYSSSVESSPRAYHHGLLSHSFPIRPAHIGYRLGYRPDSVIRRKSKKHFHHRSLRNRFVHQESEVSPSRCYNANNQNTRSAESCWNSNPTYSSPLMIPRVQHLRLEDDLTSNSETTYSSCSSCQSISSVSSPEWDSTRFVSFVSLLKIDNFSVFASVNGVLEHFFLFFFYSCIFWNNI